MDLVPWPGLINSYRTCLAQIFLYLAVPVSFGRFLTETICIETDGNWSE
jgi:hypothetical protein